MNEPLSHADRLIALRHFVNAQSQPPAPDATISDEEKVARLWAQGAQNNLSELHALRNWTSHPVTSAEIRRRVTGDRAMTWNAYLKDKFFQEPAQRGISLGCGSGQWVVQLVAANIAAHCRGVDMSPGAIDVARSVAAAQSLSDRAQFDVADLNAFDFDGAYDLIVFEQSLHHVDKLELLLDKCARALSPNGLILVNEYIGPDRFQWNDETQRLMNVILGVLPERYRTDPITGYVKSLMVRIDPQLVIDMDPSEAICSSRIMDALSARFDIVERRDFGGSLLQFLLAEIIANFDPDNDIEAAMLKLMVAFEEEMERAGVIRSDFTLCLLRNRENRNGSA